MPVDRLTAQDLAMLVPDRYGWPQDIGGLAVLDGRTLTRPDGTVRVDAVRAAIAARLHLVPRFRQVLREPRFGLGRPFWADVQNVDLSRHIRVEPLPAPRGETELVLSVERLRREPWDRSRPLWAMWLLPGLPDGRIGLFVRVHHAIADGVAGVATVGALLDAYGAPPEMTAPPWRPASEPSAGELFRDNVHGQLLELRRLLAALAQSRESLRRVRAVWPSVREAMGAERAPVTSVNGPLGPGRRLAAVRGRLEVVRRIGHANGGTINDVLMAAMAGGLRELLLYRGEPVDGVRLRAYVPVSQHHESPGQARGNLDAMMVIHLPVGEPDPVRRLHEIAAETTERRKLQRVSGGAVFRFAMLQRLMMSQMRRQHWANTYAANVPGPPVQLSLAGAPLLEMFPLVPLIGNITVGVGALSYAGQFNVTAIADADSCPDFDVFVDGLRDAFSALERSTAARPAAP